MKELVVLVTDMLNALFDWLPRMLKSMARDSLHFMKDKFCKRLTRLFGIQCVGLLELLMLR